MRHGRKIHIKSKTLMNLRLSLREFISTIVYHKRHLIREDQDKLIFDDDGTPILMTPLIKEKYRALEQEKNALGRFLKQSICACGYCETTEGDMIYHKGWGEWWCERCFKEDEEATDPSRFFNKGVIVVEYIAKPCWLLDWCPYGALVEDFRIRNLGSKFTCKVFDHDCPVFYISHKMTEKSAEIPPISEKLKDNLRSCRAFNDKKIVVNSIKKPCHVLKWCPYGTLGDDFFKREKEYMFGCNILPHDCPSFYHAEKIREPPYF